MKKYYFGLLLLTLIAASVVFGFVAAAQVENNGTESPAVSTSLVISQFQGGTSSLATDEFVEIHNISASPIDLNGYRVVYRSANGTTDVGPLAAWTTTTVLQPGQFYLIASTTYTGTATPNAVYSTSGFSISASNGGLAIRLGAMDTGTIIDAVGYGTTTNIFFEGSKTVAHGSGNSQARQQSGCQDTDNNLNDFFTQIPFAPRNTTTTIQCSGPGTQPSATMAASPSTVAPGASTLLTVTVTPATNPPSTGITVVGNLSTIGGSSTQTFFDDGSNGDATPGDNVFSFLQAVPANTTGGNKTVTATATDGQARTANATAVVTINAPTPTPTPTPPPSPTPTPDPNEDPLLFGNPSNATADVANENNYLMVKPQYTLSYSRAKNDPNWVAWRLDSSWIGTANRTDNYRPDTTLPAGWYQVTPTDYSEPLYDRGHMCPSGDRTRSTADNDATFLMTNFVPQLPGNNQGPWNDFENYCRSLAQSGNELYIITGGVGNVGTIGSTQANRIVVPEYTWKVVMVLPNGSNDLQRVTKSTRMIGFLVPNTGSTFTTPWRNYRTTVDAIERLTGYNFFSEIPKNTQEMLERKRDTL